MIGIDRLLATEWFENSNNEIKPGLILCIGIWM